MDDQTNGGGREGEKPDHLLPNNTKPEPLSPGSFPHPPGAGGRLPPTKENFVHLLAGYDVVVAYDVIRKRVAIRCDRWDAGLVDNADNAALAEVFSLAALNGFARVNVECFLEAIANSNPYNRVEEWITSKPWDGRDRLPDIYATLETADHFPLDLMVILVFKWLLSAVAAALLKSGFRCRGVLTFQGAQGIGKTRWFSALVSDPILRAMLVKIDHHMDAHNKDSILGAITHWICEIGELDSAMKRDVARIKGVLTRDSDKVRRPYLRADSEMPRRTVFAATVNHARFLVDDTGNSRWWVLPLTRVNFNHDVDMQQLFAQLAVELENGAEWWLNSEEDARLDEQNRPHRTISAVEDLVLDELELDRASESGLPAMTPRQLLVFLGIQQPANPQCKECAGVLRDYLGEPKRIQGRDKWRIPLERERQQLWERDFAPKKDRFD